MSDQKLIDMLERPRQQAFAALCLAVAPWMAALLQNIDKYIQNMLLVPAMLVVGLMAMVTGLFGCLGILWVGAKMIKHRARGDNINATYSGLLFVGGIFAVAASRMFL